MTQNLEGYKEYKERLDEGDLNPGDFISFKSVSAKLARILNVKKEEVINAVNRYWKEERDTYEFTEDEYGWVVLEIKDNTYNRFLKIPLMVDVLGVRNIDLDDPYYSYEDYTGRRYIDFDNIDERVEFSIGADKVLTFSNETKKRVTKVVLFIFDKANQDKEEVEDWDYERELEEDYRKYSSPDEDE